MSKTIQQELPFLDGKFLIAMPGMADPRFDHSVIFICAHTPEGAMGLIINRPANDLNYKALMDQLDIPTSSHIDTPDVMFGGPVEHGRGFVLHSADYESDSGTMPVNDDFSMTATLDVLRDIAKGEGPDKRLLCLGYSGWGPSQLEEEIRQNAWLICDATQEIAFADDLSTKWNAAMSSLGFDPSMLSAEGGSA